MPAATTSIDGYLTSTNFNTFNNKQPAGSYATLTGTEILTNKSISGSQITSAVSNATLAATVTTNANLTGVVTSTGNTTSIADAALSIAKTSGLQTALDSKAPASGSTSYIQNGTGLQASSNFYVSGTARSTNFGANIAPNINFGFTGAASTSTTAPFLITGGVAYTGTQAGALWYETTNDRFRFYGATATDLLKTSNNFLLQGTGVRTITANAVGDIVAVTPIVEQFTTVAEVITAITGATYSSNRATITPASSKVFLKGQFYDDGTFTYLAIADNSVRRF
jgi:hypothetical protein